MPTSTSMFFVVVGLAAFSLPTFFTCRVWCAARSNKNWRWLRPVSCQMYVDAAKSLITAAGVAVSLLASSGIASAALQAKRPCELAVFSAKVAGAALIVCLCSSISVIVTMARGYDEGWSRLNDRYAAEGQTAAEFAELSMPALGLILVFVWFSMFSFVVGFSFLGRIIYHL